MKPKLETIWNAADRKLCDRLLQAAKLNGQLANQPWARIATPHQERLEQAWQADAEEAAS